MKDLKQLTDKNMIPIRFTDKDNNTTTLGYHIKHYKIADYVFRCMIGLDEEGWEHVSVTLHKMGKKKLEVVHRTPTWQEMCFVKDVFWGEEEEVIQFHPKKAEYVNVHDFCLHLWKMKAKEEAVAEIKEEAKIEEAV